ncbi:CYTH domain-containing protein [Paenisporosarcina sp. OV554]|uniref:CYTH domain-containing protein n=1 Tax=Paenisporosarcina sp. OV554 TaxID=2135694 RepID=UPI000D3C077D|nr:CYTH domain-containing protein [Paenisporosarcina sp. OV554]PUB17910.1 adenylate cyclase [Paenisporosarcina sp. OV554]
MTIQKEIEFKNLLEEEEFHSLCRAFAISKQNFHVQTNTYFDTTNNQLRDSLMGFRLRVVGERNELTLKAPTDNVHTMMETTHLISAIERDEILSNQLIRPRDYSEFQQLPELLLAFGSLRTERAEISFQGGLLVLDRSDYLGITDYEVEYEVTDITSGQQSFNELLKYHQIPKRQTLKKIARFMKAAKR